MNKYIPTKTITLPITKYVIEVSEYLSTAALRKVQKILFDGNIQIGSEEKNVFNGKQALLWYEMQEEALKYIFISAVKSNDDGTVSPTEVLDPVQFVGELPPKDGLHLYQEISDIINRSMLNEDGKKN